MKFGVREICDVVLRAKAPFTLGNRKFYKDEPVLYFDSLKTSSMEGAATQVYAQGGRGNARLVAWEGERTVTFTMEDALISKESFAVLAGADLADASEASPVYVHSTEQIELKQNDITGSDDNITAIKVELAEKPSAKATVYLFILDDNGEVVSEPYIGTVTEDGEKIIVTAKAGTGYAVKFDPKYVKAGAIVLVDYYQEKSDKVSQITLTPESFGVNFYLEATTLFRNTDGKDLPAEFVIPNCKIQSNFTFTMASSGDPSTFTFTMDAFPDYTKFDKTKKVLSVIQIIEEETNENAGSRTATPHNIVS